MIVCVCKAVSDRHIRAAVNDGATSMRDLTRELKVGTCCGKCLPEAKSALSACLAHRDSVHATELGMTQRGESASNNFFGGATPEYAV
jgi:bacterioferritin-associated ferredoxin